MSNTSKEEMINAARRMAAMLGLVEKPSGGYFSARDCITYFENEEDPITVIWLDESWIHAEKDSYCIKLEIWYRL